MKDKSYYGCKISRGFRSATVWVFNGRTHRLIGTLKRTCAPGLPVAQRKPELQDFLKHFGISLG